ncbi:hypothetical protein ACFL5V_03065 [Fibrobacterota bacterium]
MNKWIILIVFLLSLLGAVINNLITKDPVDWIGSPPVLEKPKDY